MYGANSEGFLSLLSVLTTVSAAAVFANQICKQNFHPQTRRRCYLLAMARNRKISMYSHTIDDASDTPNVQL